MTFKVSGHHKFKKLFGIGPFGALISLFLLAVCIWADSIIKLPIADYTGLINITGIALIILGSALHFWSFFTLRSWWADDRLCTRGPFKHFRHPMYTAWITFICPGIALYLNSWFYLFWILMLHLLWHQLVKKEEILMTDEFGASYQTYARRTGRFFPKMKKSYCAITIFILLIIVFWIYAHTLLSNIFTGRVHFPKNSTDRILKMEDGQKFTVLRTLRIEDGSINTAGYSIFIVRFKFNGLSFEMNKRLSLIPAPFLINMEGFVQKFWTFNDQTNEFQGIYQWKSKKDAVNYPDSFVFKLMTKRARHGTVNYRIIPDKDINNYITNLKVQ